MQFICKLKVNLLVELTVVVVAVVVAVVGDGVIGGVVFETKKNMVYITDESSLLD